jgi:hypothetical protein
MHSLLESIQGVHGTGPQPCDTHSPASQLYIYSDTGCTAVRDDPPGVYTCMEGVISPIQLYGLSDKVCTHVHVVYSKM